LIFYVLTLFPEMFKGYIESSILGKAVTGGRARVNLVNIRDFAEDKHRTCDDAPYGGGPGMVLKPEPLARAIESIGDKRERTIYLTPSGSPLTQRSVEELSREESLTLICGHYEGIDQRIIDMYVTDEISIGDYVLFSGEVSAMVMIDAAVRLVDGVIKPESLEEESFSHDLLEYPHYTRPMSFRGREVPEVLTSGNHAAIRVWRMRQSLEKTRRLRPDLLKTARMTDEQCAMLREIEEE
jgi:tRNA (guanine37-N1)-methyltransferase